jgi:hypothetical protein
MWKMGNHIKPLPIHSAAYSKGNRPMPKREPAVCVPATDNPDVRPSNSNDDRIAALEAKVAS